MINEWDDYAKSWEANPQVVQYSKQAFNSLVNVIGIKGLTILDFGCGTGLLSELMAPEAKQIVAIDPSKEMAGVLKDKNLPNVGVIDKLLTSDLIKSNKLLSKKFDLIVASSVCGFLPNYTEVLILFKSMLIQNGTFIQWDWLVNEDGSEMGLTKNEIKRGFDNAKLELVTLTEPFSMEHEENSLPVIMATAKNL